LVDSGDDPDIDSSAILFGSDGPWVFFRTLEIMSREFDIHNPGKNQFFLSFFTKKFRLSSRKLLKILQYFDKKKRIFINLYDEDGVRMIELFCPKLKSLADEYTRVKMSKISGDSQGTLRSKSYTDNRQQTTDTDVLFVPENSGLISGLNNAFLEQILQKCEKIVQLASRDRKELNPYSFVQKAINISGHPKAIDEALDMCIKRWDQVREPWPYMMAIFKMKNGNYWEDDHVAECAKFKEAWVADDKIKDLISEIGC
jgi:hypothetical protein